MSPVSVAQEQILEGDFISLSKISCPIPAIPFPSEGAEEVSMELRVTMNNLDYTTDYLTYYFRKEELVLSLDPTDGPTAGDTIVTLTPNYFFDFASDHKKCRFSKRADPAKYNILFALIDQSVPGKLICTVPPAYEIEEDLFVNGGEIYIDISNDGHIYSSSGMSYTYFLTPTITHISNSYYLLNKQRTITLTGSHFVNSGPGKLLVRIENTENSEEKLILNGEYISSTEIRFETVLGVFGRGARLMISLTFNANRYIEGKPMETYYLPSLSLIVPSFTEILVSEEVTIYGSGFLAISDKIYCKFDAQSTLAYIYNEETLICQCPVAATPKTVTVSVCLDVEDNFSGSTLQFTYYPQLSITSITPNFVYWGSDVELLIEGNQFLASIEQMTISISMQEMVSKVTPISETELYIPLPQTIGEFTPKLSRNENLYIYNETVVLTIEICPAGFECGVSTKSECPKGSFCSLGDLKGILCEAGYYQNESGQIVCKACPANFYCPFQGMNIALNCPRGYLCESIATAFIKDIRACPEGYFCPSGTRIIDRENVGNIENVQACPNGMWCGLAIYQIESFSGAYDTPQPCLDGVICAQDIDLLPHSSKPGSTDQYGLMSCPPGKFCTTGIPFQCPLGSFCFREGMTLGQKCPPGSFSEIVGAEYCEMCPLGTFCPEEGNEEPKRCTAGRICMLTAQNLPSFLCPGGSYCGEGMVSDDENSIIEPRFVPKLCDPGTYCLPGTQTKEIRISEDGGAQNCMEGTYCEEGTEGPDGKGPCTPGHYCPANTIVPFPAQPGYFCEGEGNVQQEPCSPGTFNNATKQEICMPCPAGYFCMDEATTQPIECPIGTYKEENKDIIDCQLCPEGTWSNETQVKRVQDCQGCPKGKVCDKAGMVTHNDARPCPEGITYIHYIYTHTHTHTYIYIYIIIIGYLCKENTTSYNEYKNPCPSGYWCEKGTGGEVDYHICEKGYYCPEGTTETNKHNNKCPIGYYCPYGTAGILKEGGDFDYIKIINFTHVLTLKEERMSEL